MNDRDARLHLAAVLLVGIIRLPLRAVAATIPTLFDYGAAVGLPGTTQEYR